MPPNFHESELEENRDNFSWLEDGHDARSSSDRDVLHADEFRFQTRLAVLKQQRNDFL